MSQHDYVIANDSGANVRADINAALAAIVSRNSGASGPSPTFAYMLWPDTTNGLLKRRNAANTSWVIEGTLDETFVLARSANVTLDASDRGKTVRATGTWTQAFDACSALGDGWSVDFLNEGTGTVTLDPNASETIGGATTLALQPGQGGRIVCNGANLQLISNLPVAATRQVFTAGGTYTRPAGLRFAKVTLLAGGGGGGGAAATSSGFSAGGGGGAGGMSIRWLAASAIGATETVTIGAAGAGANGNASGTAGGNSAFGSLLTANGGSGGGSGTEGVAMGYSGGAGGTASSGDINLTGGKGHFGQVSTGGTVGFGGQGAASPLGAGGGAGTVYGASAAAASGYGAGGGGACNNIGASASTGGAGTGGICIVEEFY